MTTRPTALLALADGRLFRGHSIGAPGAALGEVVFTTSMSGYQEVLTDPSYRFQLVTMTSAEIGNVGVNEEDLESDGVKAAGLIVRSSRPFTSSWRAEGSFREFLRAQGVVAIEGVDTRALVLHIRSRGAQMGVISTDRDDPEALITRAREAQGMTGRDLAREVTTKKAYLWDRGPSWLQALDDPRSSDHGSRGAQESHPLIVAFDFGIKRSILRRLVEAGARVEVVPATTTADEVLARRPAGIFLSNGPGDPEPVGYATAAVRALLGRLPIFGICLGHQILGLAYGARSFKLPFGHRGSNQPVRDARTGRVRITSQNHGFAIDPDSLTRSGRVEVTEINLNDGTLEGFEVLGDRVLAAQYHPEASPGPHDASGHFARFVSMCRG